jgi:tRNA(fMet)-specific endonuclease VapC
MILADTDVLIDFLEGKDPGASRIAEELQKGALYTTVISRFEMLSGSKGPKQIESVRQLLESVKILALDVPAADRAAEVRRRLEQKGQGIGMADSLIAGIALEHKATLLTRNHRHYNRVEGLKLAQ